MERRCPHCGARIEPDAPETTECPVCRNIIRPANPDAKRLVRVALITVVLYFVAMFSMLIDDTGIWIAVIFGIAFVSGVYLLYVLMRFFKMGA